MADCREPALTGADCRLFGRRRGHALRARQRRLLQVTLPRLAFDPALAADPAAAFTAAVSAVWLEIGFGSGEHTRAQVTDNPSVGLIACEVFENGICSLLSKLIPEGAEAEATVPPNLRLWADDARVLLQLLPVASLDRLFLLFPDPWPKARHAKRRFVHPAILPVLGRVLRAGAEWRIASDDPTYQDWTTRVLSAQEFFQVSPPSATRPAGWPATRYEAKALREGRRPLYWSVTRR
ncbi:MAG: tRNA (guanine(46)-N(7))-methyltransferase TrmB [Acetobacteraceae bacterium]